MPWRDVTLDSGETFRVRISDKAIADWVADRHMLSTPDRPPDVDTGDLRAWLPHADEEHSPWWTAVLQTTDDILGKHTSIDTVYTAVWRVAGSQTKLLVAAFGDGSFRVRVKMESLADGRVQTDVAKVLGPEVDPDAVWDEVETIAMAVDATAMLAGEPQVPTVTTYADQLEFDTAIREARLDVIAEYGWANWAERLLGPRP